MVLRSMGLKRSAAIQEASEKAKNHMIFRPGEGSWFTYMLKCSDDSLYTGVTNNLEKRVKVHNSGKGAKYTRSRLPVKLVYLEVHPDRSSAQKAESALKKLNRAEKIEMIGDDDER